MAPEFKYFPADFAFKTCNQGRCRYHDCHTQRYRNRGDADDDPGKIFTPGKGDATGNEEGQIQSLGITAWALVGW